MKETIRRIDKLIKTCKWFSFAKYQKTGFEIADLIRSLFGTQNMYYKEYCSIVESKITSEDKGRYFVALLQAIKNHLIIQIGCDRRYKVFISSTYKAIIPYRNAVS